MITLLADRPAAAHATQIERFGRLAGLWNTHITYYPPDGSPSSHATGAWEFGYALDGRAVIDVWQVPGRDTLAGAARAADQECGLCVRIWDPRLQLWRFTFHGTAHGHLIHMYAREIDDEIVMERAEGGDLVRWIFSDIRPESFHWRSQRSTDGGASWQLEQRVRADRAATPAAAGDLPLPAPSDRSPARGDQPTCARTHAYPAPDRLDLKVGDDPDFDHTSSYYLDNWV